MATTIELLFIDHADKVVTILREAWYGIEDHMTAGGGLYLLDDDRRDFLRDAAHQVHIRALNLLDDDQRLRLREAVATAVALVLRGHESSSWEEAYRDHETIQTATTLLLDACRRLTTGRDVERERPDDLATMTVVMDHYVVSRSTLKRAIQERKLTTYRRDGRGPHLLSLAAVGNIYPRR